VGQAAVCATRLPVSGRLRRTGRTRLLGLGERGELPLPARAGGGRGGRRRLDPPRPRARRPRGLMLGREVEGRGQVGELPHSDRDAPLIGSPAALLVPHAEDPGPGRPAPPLPPLRPRDAPLARDRGVGFRFGRGWGEKDAAGCPSLPSHYGLTNPGVSRTSPAAYLTWKGALRRCGQSILPTPITVE
jgi:hypothetical protein